MAFSMTTEQVRDQSKTVTRRLGWWFLEAGDVVQPIEKGMGLKKGECVRHIGWPVRILSTRKEPLNAITPEDCAREGFPNLTPADFVFKLVVHHRIPPTTPVNRIEFEYVVKNVTEV